MAVRRLYEPLCITFGTTVSSPTVPTYQLYDLPHKFTPRLYMESEDPNLVLREIGVWAGWEQAGSANTRSFLLDLLKDEDAHDNFLLREAGPTRFRRVRGIFELSGHLRWVADRLGSARGSRQLGDALSSQWRAEAGVACSVDWLIWSNPAPARHARPTPPGAAFFFPAACGFRGPA